ncbi:MAG: c-type cytochrome [Bacteroidales bacterium]|nr:c-type cytochrome [Bacteroidales bacterium]
MTNDNIQNQDEYIHNEELDQKLMDHDYDGIKELDNPAPAWIMAIFYITIFFSVMYGAYYFWFGQGPNQDEEYELAFAEHDVEYASQKSTEKLGLLTDEASINEGMATFQQQCVACHGMNGEGGIGANLTDGQWIHGCSFDDVYKIISEGGPNGMMSYKAMLSETKIQQVSSYILTKLKGTNVAGKAAEGEACQ